MMAQYSVPFCVALSLYRDARDPDSFDERVVDDPAIRALCRRVELVRRASPSATARSPAR